jgi:hypothetical protein
MTDVERVCVATCSSPRRCQRQWVGSRTVVERQLARGWTGRPAVKSIGECGCPRARRQGSRFGGPPQAERQEAILWVLKLELSKPKVDVRGMTPLRILVSLLRKGALSHGCGFAVRRRGSRARNTPMVRADAIVTRGAHRTQYYRAACFASAAG